MSPRARLTRDRIVAAALELADERGTQALSMRVLARRLEVDPMAVYRHVSGKADLLGAMCDATLAGLPALRPGEPWEPQLRAVVGALRDALLARPSLVPVLLSAPATPAAVAVAQQAIALLTGAGLTEAQAVAAFGAIFAHAMGSIAIEIADPPPPEDAAGLRAAAGALVGDPDAPHLDAALSLMQLPDDPDAELDLLLAGIRGLVTG